MRATRAPVGGGGASGVFHSTMVPPSSGITTPTERWTPWPNPEAKERNAPFTLPCVRMNILMG